MPIRSTRLQAIYPPPCDRANQRAAAEIVPSWGTQDPDQGHQVVMTGRP